MEQKGYIMILFEDRAATVLYNILVNIPQNKFLLPLNICPIVPDTFIKAKKEFIFVDISLDNLCMNQTITMEKLKKDPSIDGILFVKTFGVYFNIEPFYKQIKEFNKNIFIIDDMCPSIQKFDCDITSSWSDLKLFSSGYSKFIDIGYGGYGFVDDSFKTIFEDNSQKKEFLEYKNTILETIPKMVQHKKELNEIYSKNIPKKYHLGNKYNNWRFSILLENKQEVLDEIFKIDGLFASSHYPQVDFDYVSNPIENTNSNMIHSKILNLFNDFRYDKEKAYKTIDIINKLI